MNISQVDKDTAMAMKESLERCTTFDDIYSVFDKHGVEFNREDLEKLMSVEEGELSDDMLVSVAGGQGDFLRFMELNEFLRDVLTEAFKRCM